MKNRTLLWVACIGLAVAPVLAHAQTKTKAAPAAEKSKAAAQKHFSQPIVTQIVPLTKFYKGEGYHQDFYRSNPNQPYCRAVIRPKVEKMEKKLQGAAH